MIETLNDVYVCISPVYKDGKLYAVGDHRLVPKGQKFESRKFKPLHVETPKVETPKEDSEPKKPKKKNPEVGV